MQVILDGSINSLLALKLFTPSEVVLLTYSFAGAKLNTVEIAKIRIKCEVLGLSIREVDCNIDSPSIFAMAASRIPGDNHNLYSSVDPFYLTKEIGSQNILLTAMPGVYPNIFDINEDIKEKIYSNYFLNAYRNSYFSTSRNIERLMGHVPGNLNVRRLHRNITPNKIYNVFFKPMLYSTLGADVNDMLVPKQSIFAEMYDYTIS